MKVIQSFSSRCPNKDVINGSGHSYTCWVFKFFFFNNIYACYDSLTLNNS